VQTLNQHVLASLLRHNLDAVSLSPGLLGYPCYSDEFAAALGRAVRQVLQAGLIPVLHGDVCLSADGRTAAIVGGDDLLKRLASMAQQAIFLTDVPAIYTSDPRVHPDAEMVPEIFVDENGDIVSTAATGTIDASDSTHPHDVTGGLRSKLSAATIMASQGTRVMVVQCGTRSAEQALFGEEVDVGTRMVHSA
jgi:isopentenyl phosphate kinase